MKRLFLIDGHALIFRVYYAFLRRPMVNSKGEDTSILFGFTKNILDLLQKEKPTHFAVAFDPPTKSFRHDLYPEYKANRSATPELIKESTEPLTELLEALSIPVLMMDGYEADDVIGAYAKAAEREGFQVYMVTPDKDYGQLLSDNIFQYKPARSGKEEVIMGREEICKEHNLTHPEQVIELLALQGDSSDNIPGVRGVGPVGAEKLLTKFGSIEAIYENIEKLTPKQREAFEEARNNIPMAVDLITIRTDLETNFKPDKFELKSHNFEEIRELFLRYEFLSLINTLPKLEELFKVEESTPTTPAEGPNLFSQQEESEEQPTWKREEINEVVSQVLKEGYLALALDETTLYWGAAPKMANSPLNKLEEELLQLFSNPQIPKIGYNLKELVRVSENEKFKWAGEIGDIELMHYLLMPERSHKIELLAQSYLNREQALSTLTLTAEEELPLLYPLYRALREELEREEQLQLYLEMEMPLLTILAKMERDGVKLDKEMLHNYGSELSKELAEIEREARELGDEPTLNLSSPKQLGILLYEKLKVVERARRTAKRNYSTDEETLTSIKESHPIIPLILEYRALKKLLSTYIEPLPALISPETERLHTTFNQALTATGRLSSIKPNLQNIPIRTERGREIRRAFIATDREHLLLSADYSQIELRLMAHMSEDPHFIEAFKMGKDIHAATAARIFGRQEEEVTREERDRAKVANFGIIYGISAFGLTQRLSIPYAESKKLIDDYFASYPEVERYINSSLAAAREEGFVTTLYGRKRYLPDINSRNSTVRGMAERNAINAPIQGSAADIIKAAMVNLSKRIEEEGLKAKMILQVHDELLFDLPKEELEPLSKLVKEEMERVIELKVPLIVEWKSGDNWLEAH